MVDLNQGLMQSKGLAPQDVLTAVQLQNLIVPSGTAKMGPFEYDIRLNGSPKTVAELSDLPVKVVGNSTIYLRDVANLRDGFAPQTNIVRQDGRRGALVSVLKAGNASTIAAVTCLPDLLPRPHRGCRTPRRCGPVIHAPHLCGVLGDAHVKRCSPVALCAAGRRRGVRHAPVAHPVPDARSYAGDVFAESKTDRPRHDTASS